jgi:hypothetical protein
VGPDGAELHRAFDAARDQSYFLFATTPEQLDYLRFPLGGLPKPAVRAAATALGLKVADKPDSQDICFVPEGRYTTVIDRLRPHGAEPGDIVHLDGRVLGRHEGVTGYTIGQRRGLNVAVGDPLFVVKIDADSRRVMVGPREALLTRALFIQSNMGNLNELFTGNGFTATGVGGVIMPTSTEVIISPFNSTLIPPGKGSTRSRSATNSATRSATAGSCPSTRPQWPLPRSTTRRFA